MSQQRPGRFIGKKIADRFCITGEIGKGGMGVVYRAIPFDDPSHSVAIKVIQRSGKLNYDDIMRFQKEASLMSQLHHPNIVVFHELGLFGRETSSANDLGSGYYIVMEIADGTNLKESLNRDGRKDLAYFFQIGLQVSSALDYTHGKNIIHRDIKPHNIVVGQAWKDQRGVTVKVLDFGVARLAEAMNYAGSRDGSQRPHEEAAGTPLYMAPEQTQWLDAPVDHRVDLYSLGCVLYETLAGKPPFTANSREKLEKQHVFADPEPLTHLRPDVPVLIEKIVHKLLAKHPDDRYQTAFALHADLMRAKQIFEDSGHDIQTASFALGLKDTFQAVSAQLDLVGRRDELAKLMEEFEGVAGSRGRSRLTLINGEAGIGKTRLMNEFQAYLIKRKVRFINGTFSQHENNLPFNALANAFNEYLYRLMKNYPGEAEELKRRLKTTIGPMANSIAEVVPGLKPYLKDYAEEAEDEVEKAFDSFVSGEAFSTFAKTFSDFTRCLSGENQTMVFLFHDLHWADDKSLDLIDQFFSNANTQQFHLVVSERTGTHVENPRFRNFIDKFSKLRRRFVEIELGPMDRDSVRKIIGNMLSSKESVSEDLTDYLYGESKGNPMHIVELTRTLVARDLIYPKPQSSSWEYRIEEIKKSQIHINTIDLLLSRIQQYHDFDRQLLCIASTIGLTFQFEILLLGNRAQSVPIMRALQRATEEGLIVRISDDPDLRHLGKTFMFAHKKARDAIYDGIDFITKKKLHKAIGEKLEASVPEPNEKTLFALAHHFNSALDQGRTDDRDLAERALKHNQLAGQAAYQNGSWQTAERYFENALKLMEQWQNVLGSKQEKAHLQELLADLAAAQRNHGRALQAYRELLKEDLEPVVKANIAFKAVYFQAAGGIVTDTLRLIEVSLSNLGKTFRYVKVFSFIISIWSLFLDSLPMRRQNTRLYKILAKAFNKRKQMKNNTANGLADTALRLYHIGSQVFTLVDRKQALYYQHLAMKEAVNGDISSYAGIRIVADRAAILGYAGFYKVAYRFFDLAMDVAKACKNRNLYGYVALQRVLTLDYVKSRQEEISTHLKEALRNLDMNEDRLSYGMALYFRAFRELLRCNPDAVYEQARKVHEVVPTRHPIAARVVAMTLYVYLLQGARDYVVKHGETFLEKRKQLLGRNNDSFVKVIHTLISFAKGETDKTREHFISGIKTHLQQRKREFLYPFEEDFIAIFFFTFPDMFEHEFGRHLMREDEMANQLGALKKTVWALKGGNRAVPLLLKARMYELNNNKVKVRTRYDESLRAAKVGGCNLAQVFAYYWFGSHLLDHGQSQKKDYIRRAYMMAGKLELRSLAELIRKVAEKRKISVELHSNNPVADQGSNKTVSRSLPVISKLCLEHLQHVCEAADSEENFEEDLHESVRLLTKVYKAEKVYCILFNQQGESRLVPAVADEARGHQIINYLEPYFNVRSTLFLPINDAPWTHDSVENQQSAGDLADGPKQKAFSSSHSRTSTKGKLPANLEQTHDDREGIPDIQTEVLDGQFHDALPTAELFPHGEAKISDTNYKRQNLTKRNDGEVPDVALSSSVIGNASLQMSALIPLRSSFQNIGVLFIEDFGNFHQKDTTQCRQELDQFGSQLGLLVERKVSYDAPSTSSIDQSTANAIYQPASYTLEESSWLTLWQHGRLRAQRETSWYLGLNFDENQYVLTYCLLHGHEHVREHLGAMLWHHLYVLRALSIASGRVSLDISELREEIAGLLTSFHEARQLENITLAFTIFNRKEKTALSGHFGQARPLVYGVENRITPYNQVVLNLASGLDLRYWEVNASLQDPHAYILSYDTSKIAMGQMEATQQQMVQSLARTESTRRIDSILRSLIRDENLPRYYLGALLRSAHQQTVRDGELENDTDPIPFAKAE